MFVRRKYLSQENICPKKISVQKKIQCKERLYPKKTLIGTKYLCRQLFVIPEGRVKGPLEVVLNQVNSKNDYVLNSNSNYFIFICSISFEWYDYSSRFRRNLPSGSGQHATRGRDHTPIGN